MQTRERTGLATTSRCNGSSLYEEILHKSRFPTDKSIPGYGHGILPCLQNGGMPPAYPDGDCRSAATVARYVACLCFLSLRMMLKFCKEFITNDPAKIGECEFFLISEMHSQLIVHHPYRTVSELSKVLELTTEDVNQATNLISDHYQTDLPLLYPPHIIAVMAILLAVIFGGGSGNAGSGGGGGAGSGSQRNQYIHGSSSIASSLREGGMGVALSALGSGPTTTAATTTTTSQQGGVRPDARIHRIVNWLAESEIDIRAVIECTQEIISLYELMDGLNIQHWKEVISRMTKNRNADK